MNVFFKKLKVVRLDNVFNPWFQQDRVNDIDSKYPSIRRLQLEQYLSERKKAKYLLIAEALGISRGAFHGNSHDL